MNDETNLEPTVDEHGEEGIPPPDRAGARVTLPPDENGKLHDGGVGSDKAEWPFFKQRTLWIVVAAVAVIVVTGVVGGVAWNQHAKDQALSSCRQYAGQVRELVKTPLGKNVVEAEKVSEKDVADGESWKVLHRDQKKLTDLTQKGVPVCDATSRSAAQKQESVAAASLKSLKSARAAVTKSAKKVLASREAKTLKDTQSALAAKAAQAKQLLDSSAGTVADDATRRALSQQIDTANGLLGNKQSKLADLQQTSQALDSAMNSVNASAQAKAAADAEAAQAAAKAQAEAARKRSAGRSKSGGANRGGSSGSGSQGRATSVPQIHGFVDGGFGPDYVPGGHDNGPVCFGPNDCG